MSNAALSPLHVIMRQPDGCHLHNHCLTCPLARCYFEDNEGDDRDDEARHVRELREAGRTVAEVMEAMGISRRKVFYLSARDA